MKNAYAIGGVCRQIIKTCERIETMASDAEGFEHQNQEALAIMFGDLALEELEHVQKLVLSLTSLVVEANTGDEGEASAANADDSVFAEGDLTEEKTVEETE